MTVSSPDSTAFVCVCPQTVADRIDLQTQTIEQEQQAMYRADAEKVRRLVCAFLRVCASVCVCGCV